MLSLWLHQHNVSFCQKRTREFKGLSPKSQPVQQRYLYSKHMLRLTRASLTKLSTEYHKCRWKLTAFQTVQNPKSRTYLPVYHSPQSKPQLISTVPNLQISDTLFCSALTDAFLGRTNFDFYEQIIPHRCWGTLGQDLHKNNQMSSFESLLVSENS